METSFLQIARGGVTRYILELSQALRNLDADLDLREFGCPVPNLEYQQPARALKTIYREYFWTPHLSGRILKKIRPDVVHLTCFPDIRVPPDLPKVVTLYDLSHLRHPKAYRPYTRIRWRRLLRKVSEADAVITISEFSRREALELLPLDPKRVTTIPLAPTLFGPPRLPLELPPLLPSSFFLFVGSLTPHKNLNLLIEAYRVARERGLNLPPLCVIGARVEGVDREYPPPTDWIFLGRASDDTLKALYEQALALVFPSYYEGFGLPILEAMRLGCPVICSPVASLPEAGGTAAHFAEQDPEAYAQALDEVAQDATHREDLTARGLTHAASFSWEQTARRTLDVYRGISHSR